MKLRFGSKTAICAAAALISLPPAIATAQNWNAEYREDVRGHTVGNPDAPVKLTAFVSYTCSVCAAFEIRSDAPLRAAYIHEGKVEMEVRPAIHNPVDLAAALIAECGPKEKFFDNHRRIIFAQSVWMRKVQNANEAQQARWYSGSTTSRMRAIAADLDFYDLMETRGYSRSQLDRCLADEARADALAEMSAADKARVGYPGTPSFLINGTLVDGAHSWGSLQPAIDASLSSGE